MILFRNDSNSVWTTAATQKWNEFHQ